MIYIVPFKEDGSLYIASLKQIATNWARDYAPNRLVTVLTHKTLFTLLWAPFRSIVIVEDIHTSALWTLIRLDLRVFHYPRGGCTLKVGWRDSGKLTPAIRLKLLRRNKVFLNSTIFCDYLSAQEGTPRKRYFANVEPVVFSARQTNPPMPTRKDKTICLAFSEDRNQEFYCTVIDLLKKAALGLNIVYSAHPANDFDLKECRRVEILDPDIDVLITDCVSAAFYYFALSKPVIILKESQSHSRRLFAPQESFFSGIFTEENICAALANNRSSKPEISLSTEHPFRGW